MPVVIYTATVRDVTGRQRKFDFEHSLTDSEFSDALQHKQDVGFFGRLSSEHNADILAAETWMCTGKDGCEKQATTLLNTPASCLNQTPPRVIDMCPIPICDDAECSRIAKTKTKSMLTKLAENLLAEAKPPSSDEAAATNSAGQPDKCGRCQVLASPEISLKCCARCKSAYYCSKECQTSHWKVHKKSCGLASLS